MFLHKGLHFRSIQDMLGYALLDESFAAHSEEYNQGHLLGDFECSLEHSLEVLRQVREELVPYNQEDLDVQWYYDLA